MAQVAYVFKLCSIIQNINLNSHKDIKDKALNVCWSVVSCLYLQAAVGLSPHILKNIKFSFFLRTSLLQYFVKIITNSHSRCVAVPCLDPGCGLFERL